MRHDPSYNLELSKPFERCQTYMLSRQHLYIPVTAKSDLSADLCKRMRKGNFPAKTEPLPVS